MSKVTTQAVTRRRFLSASGLAVGVIVLAACGAGNAAKPTPLPAPAAATAGPTPPSAPAAAAAGSTPTELAAGSTASIEVDTASAPDEFKYMQAALEAPAGSTIELKLVNKTQLKDEIGHNWVLVKPGQEDSVIANGKAAGDDKDWLQVDDPGILAATRLIEGSETDTITFAAPVPGAYTYLCTFPQHYAGGEKGTLTIS